MSALNPSQRLPESCTGLNNMQRAVIEAGLWDRHFKELEKSSSQHLREPNQPYFTMFSGLSEEGRENLKVRLAEIREQRLEGTAQA
jgi:hypothetical protein